MIGFIIIGLSAAMIPTREMPWVSIMLRDVGMILLAGIFFPFFYILRSGAHFDEFGLTLKRWHIVLPINLILGGLLLLLFVSEKPPEGIRFDLITFTKITYIFMAGVFEVIFFYSFQRTLFEQAFGIIPGIFLAALFYSLHHVGFQPEFGKLFFVGLMYAVVFRLGNSALMIYPFFWGVGGCYDVLVQSQEVSPILYSGIRSIFLTISIFAMIILAWKSANLSKHEWHSDAPFDKPVLSEPLPFDKLRGNGESKGSG